MGSRTLTNVITPNTIAMNAFIYGYAGHSLVTPHTAIQQVWWTQERIDAKVTPEFISSRLRPDERRLLHRPLGFGSGLTDDTYLDWILERAKRLFLTLVECGVPEQIFGVIDDSFDDDDLPVPLETVETLALSYENDEQLNQKFYMTQFTYLLRELREGVHIEYGPNEVIPLEMVQKLPPAVYLQKWSRVHLPRRADEIFVRRKVNIGDVETDTTSLNRFLQDIETSKLFRHEHVASVWASYTTKGTGYFLTPFVGEHTLRSYIDHRNPMQLQRVPKGDRHPLLLNWLHCLADAVAALHRHGLSHSAIRPSNIIIDKQNNIAFSDIGSLQSFQRDKKSDPTETYNYGAPEAHIPTPTMGSTPDARKEGTTSRQSSVSSKGSSGQSISSASSRKHVVNMSSLANAGFDFGFDKTSPLYNAETSPNSFVASKQADVYALGCVFVDILTFILKKKPTDFVKHRASKHKVSQRGGSRVDSSFHANLEHVSTWLIILEESAAEGTEPCFKGITYITKLVRTMLEPNPIFRPTARVVADTLSDILLNFSELPSLHCSHYMRARADSKRSLPSTFRASTDSSSFGTLSLFNSISEDTAGSGKVAARPKTSRSQKRSFWYGR
ncbi:kinase-like protein [Patellaria atrata CBS 101060]|uniref:Kinase-like protein n=1 Tax=Patellaria atrata CBS 101060 TaxID=1346257 RepID=A0A9P4SFW5_9PEZI|nr:kinase-like protein [Patellaria atrata CBS 101060]